MTIHSSILAWKIPYIEEPGGLQSVGSQRVGTQLSTHAHTHTHKHIANKRSSGPGPDHNESTRCIDLLSDHVPR